MASTEQIMSAARELGGMIAKHEAAARFEAVLLRLRDDVASQRLLNDYQRKIDEIAEKEANGQPIEVEDKRQAEKLQNDVIKNPLLRDFQMAQMDYLDLLRRVDEAMTGPDGADASGPAAGPALDLG